MAETKRTFEDALKRLEEIVSHLEKGDLPLQESLSAFEEGTELVRSCSTMLEEAEQKVVMLRAGSDGSAEETVFHESSLS